MAAKLEKTKTPGIYRRGNSYVVVYRFRGEQRKRFARSFAEARDLKATLTADIRRGDHREATRTSVDVYAREWIDSYQGRSTRGFRESTRVGYRRSVEQKIARTLRSGARRWPSWTLATCACSSRGCLTRRRRDASWR